jgi:hypothetical protein
VTPVESRSPSKSARSYSSKTSSTSCGGACRWANDGNLADLIAAPKDYSRLVAWRVIRPGTSGPDPLAGTPEDVDAIVTAGGVPRWRWTLPCVLTSLVGAGLATALLVRRARRDSLAKRLGTRRNRFLVAWVCIAATARGASRRVSDAFPPARVDARDVTGNMDCLAKANCSIILAWDVG